MAKIIAIFALFAVATFAMRINQIVEQPAISEDIIAKVNGDSSSSWVAGKNAFFEGKTLSQAKKYLGWVPNPKTKASLPIVKPAHVADLPENFTSAAQWPQCTTIGTIYNQAECGSCWAFGAVEAISDRWCISKGVKYNVIQSFMQLVSCGPDNGCEGGDAGDAWGYAAESGLVTDTCYPYTIPTCAPAQQPCLNFVATPSCGSGNCSDSESWSPLTISQAYNVNSDPEDIMNEIYKNGPVEACFDVYQDFIAYKTGVYQCQSSDYLGGHCVKIIGWGVENGLPYWLVNNSWTTYWGDNGQFKILRGSDACGIEDDVVAGTP